MRLALEAGLINANTTFFDYGCGLGGDLERVAKLGYRSAGWDPHYCPDLPLVPADVVNLGYVINVIEDPAERREALLKGSCIAIEALDPLLRLYEGCASRTIGRPQEANVIKFHLRKPKISYLVYPTFDIDPHPALHTSMDIDLRDLHVHYRDYDPNDNPPLLHQKDALVTTDYPPYEKFAKLTRQEEAWGLLDDLHLIYDTHGWQQCLKEHCAELRGQRVVWRKDADPYRVKLVKSIQRQRINHRLSHKPLQPESLNPDNYA